MSAFSIVGGNFVLIASVFMTKIFIIRMSAGQDVITAIKLAEFLAKRNMECKLSVKCVGDTFTIGSVTIIIRVIRLANYGDVVLFVIRLICIARRRNMNLEKLIVVFVM